MGDFREKYNLKSPAVKRLMREAAELRGATEQYCAQPLDENLFEWHFTVRGPPDTEFSDGRYHGRITLPPEYPMKPPSIILLTANGRFELGKKICLSMSAHHPETWQPSWSIRTVLLALIGFMPSKGAGAIGSLDYTPAERTILAKKSMNYKCDTCGMDHATCLKEVDPDHQTKDLNEIKELANQITFKGEAEKSTSSDTPNAPTISTSTPPAFINDASGNPLSPLELQQFQQFLQQMQLQPGYTANTPPYYAPPQSNLPTANPNTPSETYENVTTSSEQTLTNTVNDNVASSNENEVRRRVVPPQPTATPHQMNIPANTNAGRSFVDTITLVLMWIIAALLVALILRRLAMEGASLTKS